MDLSTIDDLEFFDQLARARSLTEAARTWGRSVSAVSKRLSHLETRLGVQLIRRSTRRMSLTEEGRRYAEGAQGLLERRHDLEESITARRGTLKGRITVQCTRGLGRTHIAPLLGAFTEEHPEVEVDLQLTSLPLDLARTDFDIAIRVGELRDSRLQVRRLARNRRVVCAAPSYLTDHATPQSTADLDEHNCIVLRENHHDYALWRFGAEGREIVRVDGSLSADDGEVVTDWCARGLGLIMRSTWHVAPMLAAGTLVRVLPDIETPPADIFALVPESTLTPRRVSALIDHLGAGLTRRLEDGGAEVAGA